MVAMNAAERSPRKLQGQGPAQPILALDAAGVLTRANLAARRLLGIDRNDDMPELGTLLARFLGTRQGRPTATVTLSRDSTEEHEILVVLSEGPVAEMRVVPFEASPEPPAAAGLQDTATADFIAHELRNPLSAILGISQILEDRAASFTPEERREALETIHSEADRALLILQGLLRLAEARSQRPIQLASVPLHSVGRKVIADHCRRNPHRSITLSGDSPLYAGANSMWVELALANLLSNAEKYTPRDRQIEVVFRQVGSWATILVLDNGPGLEPELYRTLWEIYSRGAEPGVQVSGSGIGLALCKELIESMGGHVWAGPGRTRGSVFALSLPLSCDMTVPAALGTPISEAEPPAADHEPMGWR